MQEVTKKNVHDEKNKKMQKNSCQIALFSSKTATKSLKLYIVFCFGLQPYVKIRLYKLGCKLRPDGPAVRAEVYFYECYNAPKTSPRSQPM